MRPEQPDTTHVNLRCVETRGAAIPSHIMDWVRLPEQQAEAPQSLVDVATPGAPNGLSRQLGAGGCDSTHRRRRIGLRLVD